MSLWIRFPVSALCLFLFTGVVASQQPSDEDYADLWTRGEYAQALERMELDIGDRPETWPPDLQLDYAELLFTVGRVDDALQFLIPLTRRTMLPRITVRVAELLHYRGRQQEYEIMLRFGDYQAERLSRYRLDPEDQLAVARLNELKGADPKQVLASLNQISSQYPTFIPAYLTAGNLAYRKRTFDLAARNYGRALEVEPNHQEALAGLAESYYASGDPRWRETTARLIEINPHHPRALLVQAEALLDLGQTDAAMEILDRVLGINPHQLNALSLKAAALFLADRPEGAAEVQGQTLTFNPRASQVYRIPGRLASRHYLFEAGRDFQTEALKLDPGDLEARTLLAFDLLRLGEDANARAELERVFKEDPYSVRAYNLLEVSDAIRQFKTVERGLFRFQAPEQETRVLADPMFALLDEAATRYQQKYRTTLQPPVTLQVFDDHDEFIVRSVGLPGHTGHLGICFGRLVTMDSPRARPPGTTNWRQVLWHEFVHVITLQKTHNRLPRWLSEGISVYEETEKDSTWGQPLSPAFKPILNKESFPGLDDLERYFVQPASPDHLMLGYYAAGAFVRFYVENYGMEALVASLDRIGEGAETSAALEQAAGVPRKQIESGFRKRMKTLCEPLHNLSGPTDASLTDLVRRLNPNASSKAPFTEALKQGEEAAAKGEQALAEKAFLEAYRLFPDYRDSDAPLRQIVSLYEGDGPPEKYTEALERVVQWDRQAFDECLKLARIRATDGRWAEALKLVDRAFSVSPFDVSMLGERARYLIAAGNLEEAEATVRDLIYLDTPRQIDHRLTLVKVLAQRGATSEAKREVIGLLEEMPTFWEAQEMLLKIVDGQ